MINAEFFLRDGRFYAFALEGHSGYDNSGRDILCAAVSSASIMAANTITEIIKASANVEDKDGYINLALTEENKEAENLIEGLLLFLNSLAQQYPEYLKVITEVKIDD